MSLPSHVPRWVKVTNIMRLIVPPELIIRLLRKIRRGPCGVVATLGRGGRAGLDGTWARGGASHCRQALTRTLVCRPSWGAPCAVEIQSERVTGLKIQGSQTPAQLQLKQPQRLKQMEATRPSPFPVQHLHTLAKSG